MITHLPHSLVLMFSMGSFALRGGLLRESLAVLALDCAFKESLFDPFQGAIGDGIKALMRMNDKKKINP